MAAFDHSVYWEKRLAGSQGLQGVGYLGLGQAFNEWMYAVRRSAFRRIVRRHMPDTSGRCVLDVGSGTGEYLQLWKQLGVSTIHGSDLTATAVEQLVRRFPEVRITRMDISNPAVQLGRYDAVSCMDVLFHVVDAARFEQALSNLSSALLPGGHLFISDHFLQRAMPSEEHFTTRTLAEYEAVLSRCGLRILERRPMFHLMNLPADARSPLLHRWWGLVIRICERSNFIGGLLGAVVFPLELLLVRLRREGVSTEIMVCTTA